MQRIVVTTIYVIGIAGFLSLIPGMEKVSNSILASAGIMAMAVGLASQDALSNIVGGLFIIFSHPFKLGDYIEVDNVIKGTVLEITLRHTVIRDAENRMILVPNNKINSSTIINSSYGDTATCAFVEVGVSYTVDLNRAIDIMRDEVMKHPGLLDHRTEEEKKERCSAGCSARYQPRRLGYHIEGIRLGGYVRRGIRLEVRLAEGRKGTFRQGKHRDTLSLL